MTSAGRVVESNCDGCSSKISNSTGAWFTSSNCGHKLCGECVKKSLDDVAMRRCPVADCSELCLLCCAACEQRFEIPKDREALKTHDTTTCSGTCSGGNRSVDECCDSAGTRTWKRKPRCIHCRQVQLDMDDHVLTCDSVIVSCPYCDERGIRRGDLENHFSRCCNLPKPCSLVDLGCKFTGSAEALREHENLPGHLQLIGDFKRETDSRLESSRQMMESLNLTVAALAQEFDKYKAENAELKQMLQKFQCDTEMKLNIQKYEYQSAVKIYMKKHEDELTKGNSYEEIEIKFNKLKEDMDLFKDKADRIKSDLEASVSVLKNEMEENRCQMNPVSNNNTSFPSGFGTVEDDFSFLGSSAFVETFDKMFEWRLGSAEDLWSMYENEGCKALFGKPFKDKRNGYVFRLIFMLSREKYEIGYLFVEHFGLGLVNSKYEINFSNEGRATRAVDTETKAWHRAHYFYHKQSGAVCLCDYLCQFPVFELGVPVSELNNVVISVVKIS